MTAQKSFFVLGEVRDGRIHSVTRELTGKARELADSVGSWVTVIMGVIFVVCVLLFRRGIVGELQALIQRAGIR